MAGHASRPSLGASFTAKKIAELALPYDVRPVSAIVTQPRIVERRRVDRTPLDRLYFWLSM
jgi:hypothetical protein